MKSTTGAHFLALDHVRAVAAFLVVAWHFVHGANGFPVPFEGAPLLPFAIFDEGHTGVALFMALSGYLFAKLIGDGKIHYPVFLLNRALRLLPLLAVVVLVVGVQLYVAGVDMAAYAARIAAGVLLPSLPNGGWSITAEAHFYLLLPVLLLLLRRSPLLAVGLVVAAIALRLVLWQAFWSVQVPAYATLVGRFDQFMLGMLLFHLRHHFAGRHAVAAAVAAAFLAFYWWFDSIGGYYQLQGFPSRSPLWVILPTIEGAAYAVLIAWYDNSFSPRAAGASRLLARFGELSYGIYLLHFFFVFHAARLAHEHVMDLSNFYVALAWAVAFYGLMYFPAALANRFIERPALRMRRPYLLEPRSQGAPEAAATA